MGMASTDKPLALTVDEKNAAASADDRLQEEAAGLKPLLIAVICTAVFLLSLDRTIVAVAIPQITDQFHSYSDVGWYGSAYLITVCALQPIFGRLYADFDTKWTYIGAFGVFEVGSLLCGVAPSSHVLIVGRAIAGSGAAGMLSGSYVIVAQVVPLKTRPIYTAGVSILFSLGAVLAPLIGGGFTSNVTWRWCFYLNLPIGLPAMAAMTVLFNPPRTTNASGYGDTRPSPLARILALDFLGIVLLLGAAVMLFLALQYASDSHPWNSPLVAGLATGAAASFMALLGWTIIRQERALIPLRLLTQRTVLASAAAAVTLYGALTTHVYYLPIYFQAIRDSSPLESAVDLLPLVIATSIFSIAGGVLVTVTKLFAPFAILGSIMSTTGAGLLTLLGESTSTANWVGFQVLAGIGYGIAVQQGFFAVQTVLPAKDVPIGTSLITFCQSLGGALGVSIGEDVLLESLRGKGDQLESLGVDIDAVIETGATAFRKVVTGRGLNALLAVYAEALKRVFVMAVAFAGTSLLASIFLEMKSLESGESVQAKTDAETHTA